MEDVIKEVTFGEIPTINHHKSQLKYTYLWCGDISFNIITMFEFMHEEKNEHSNRIRIAAALKQQHLLVILLLWLCVLIVIFVREKAQISA